MNTDTMSEHELREAMGEAEADMDRYDAAGSMIAFDRARDRYLMIESELLLRETEGRLGQV